MSDYMKTALEVLKLAPRYLVAVGLVAGVFVFLPVNVLAWLSLDEIARNYRPWFAIGFIVPVALFLVDRTVAVSAVLHKRRAEGKWKKSVHQRLQRLTEDEKQILRYYYANRTRANSLRIDDGVVIGLVEAGILYRAASMGNIFEGFAHNMAEEAWEYMWAHPEILDGTTNVYRTDKRPSRSWNI